MTRFTNPAQHGIAASLFASLFGAALVSMFGLRSAASQDLDPALVQEQRILLDRADRLRTMMQRLRERYVEQKHSNHVELLNEGLEWLEKSGLTTAMNEAGAALERKLTSKALEAQERVVADLEKLLAILMDRRSVEDLDKDMDRVEQQLRDLDRMRSQEARIRERIAELREQARTDVERKLTSELKTLASRQERLASDNAGKSSPLQDQLEQTLRDVAALRALESRLDAALKTADADDAGQGQRIEKLPDLTNSVEAHVAELAKQRRIEEAGRELDKALEPLERGDASSQDAAAAAERVNKAADRIAPRGAAREEGAKAESQIRAYQAMQAAAEALEEAARREADAGDEALSAEAKAKAAKALSRSKEAFDSARREAGRNSSERAAAEARAARDLAAEVAAAATPPQTEAKASPNADAEASKRDLERAGANLEAVAAEGAKAAQGDADAARKAEAKAQAALRNLMQALTRENAALERPSNLAQRAASTARRNAEEL
ncbi:MAG TPA: hypothetical protein PKE00_01430, partial [Planctomycetota bacterium]|nr:hypothetical protein [Planctomycetota bacterium]